MTETYIIRVYLQHKEAKGLRKATDAVIDSMMKKGMLDEKDNTTT